MIEARKFARETLYTLLIANSENLKNIFYFSLLGINLEFLKTYIEYIGSILYIKITTTKKIFNSTVFF